VRVPQESDCYVGTVVLLLLLLMCVCMRVPMCGYYMCVCQHAHCLRGVRLITGAGDLTLEGLYDGIATEIDSDLPPLGGEGH